MMTRWHTTEQFDPAKFKARYSITDADFQWGALNGEFIVRWDVSLAQIPHDPIFDPPDPPPAYRTRAYYAARLADIILPTGTIAQKVELIAVLRKFIGDLPPDTV